MNALFIIQLVLSLLNGVLNAALKSSAPSEIIAAIQAAIASVEAVQGTSVTKGQLDDLMVNPKW